jgi:hypothetical protein
MYLLAHTQGLVPTDNFEFLADFYLTKNLKFVSEIAGLTYSSKICLGHIKKIHSKVFYDKRADNLKITVKSIDKNGVVKRAFIEIINKGK